MEDRRPSEVCSPCLTQAWGRGHISLCFSLRLLPITSRGEFKLLSLTYEPEDPSTPPNPPPSLT